MREWESNTYSVGSEACFSFEVTDAIAEACSSFRCAGINEAGRRLLLALHGPLEVWGEEGTGGFDEEAFREVLDTGSEVSRVLWIGSSFRSRQAFRARLRREGPHVILGLRTQAPAEGSLRRRPVEGARRGPPLEGASSGPPEVPAPAAPPRQQSFEWAPPTAPPVSAPPPPALPADLLVAEPGPVLVPTPPRATPALRTTDARFDLPPGLAREVIWELDIDAGTYRWGETLTCVLGWKPTEARTRTWNEGCVHPSERAGVLASFQHALEGASRIWSATFRFRRPDGSYLPIHNRAHIVRRGDGTPLRLVGCLVDLTEAQEMESRQARENELRERFIGILGHDLRTPLNAITLSAQTLRRRSPLSQEQQQVVGRIQSSAARMERMIRDILDLTRARLGGGIPIRPARCDPHGLGRRVLAEARAVYPDHDLRFESHGGGRLLADAERLEQAVANLIANACQYGPTERPITVVSELEPTQWRLSVHNWGPVIQDVRPDELFEPFRSRRRPDSNPEGLGLGLYIVREIAAAHGGRIGVTSSEESGTRFWLEIPGTQPPP